MRRRKSSSSPSSSHTTCEANHVISLNGSISNSLALHFQWGVPMWIAVWNIGRAYKWPLTIFTGTTRFEVRAGHMRGHTMPSVRLLLLEFLLGFSVWGASISRRLRLLWSRREAALKTGDLTQGMCELDHVRAKLELQHPNAISRIFVGIQSLVICLFVLCMHTT